MNERDQSTTHSIEDMSQLINDGRLTEAESSLRIIVREEPKSAEAWFYLGTVHLMSKRPREAKEALEKASKLGPKLAGVWMNLAGVYEMLGDKKKAEKAYKKCLKINSKDAEALYALSKLYKSKGRMGDALYYMEKAMKINPQLVDAFKALERELSMPKLPESKGGPESPEKFLEPVELKVSDFDTPWIMRFNAQVRNPTVRSIIEKEIKISFADVGLLLYNIARYCLMNDCEASMHAIRNFTGLDAFSLGALFTSIGERYEFYYTLRSDYSKGHDEMFTFHRGKNPYKLF